NASTLDVLLNLPTIISPSIQRVPVFMDLCFRLKCLRDPLEHFIFPVRLSIFIQGASRLSSPQGPCIMNFVTMAYSLGSWSRSGISAHATLSIFSGVLNLES